MLIVEVFEDVESYESKLYKKIIVNGFFRDQWQSSIMNENNSLFENEIWIFINLFKDRIAFRDKWIYIFKRDVDDQIIRYKVR